MIPALHTGLLVSHPKGGGGGWLLLLNEKELPDPSTPEMVAQIHGEGCLAKFWPS